LPDRRGERAEVGAALIGIEDQRHFRARGHTVASQLLVLGSHLVIYDDRVARVIDGKQVWIDGVTLGMAYALGLFETNPHKVPSIDGVAG
jgi:hypothetical protein